MESHAETVYRLRLADYHLALSDGDLTRSQWVQVVDNSQLATENAAKAAIALWRPVPRSHEPADVLMELAEEPATSPQERDLLLVLAACSERLGYKTHQQVSYGDDNLFIAPWELFGEKEAEDALAVARQAVEAAHQLRGIREKT